MKQVIKCELDGFMELKTF